LRKHGDQLRVLLVNMEQGDFVARSEDFQRIVEAIEAGSNHMQYRLDF
jgi:translation elongation factor EF-Ts